MFFCSGVFSMNSVKLKEALVELKHQRALLENAIANVEEVLKTLNGVAPDAVAASGKPRESESYIDLAVRILEEAGKPMHIAEIAKKVSAIRGKTVPRASVESSLLRHMNISRSNPRVVKVRPAHFGLPIWKTFAKEPSTTLSVAS
jgi:HB1, ASXL, restriction endonuclease HTH domain